MSKSRHTRKQKPHQQIIRLTDLSVQTVLYLFARSSGQKRRFFVASVIAAAGVSANIGHVSVYAFSQFAGPHIAMHFSRAQLALPAKRKRGLTTPARLPRTIESPIAAETVATIRGELHYFYTYLVARYMPASQTVRGSPAS